MVSVSHSNYSRGDRYYSYLQSTPALRWSNPACFRKKVTVVSATATDMRSYEEVVAFLGEWGPYQKLMFFILSFSIFSNGFCGLSFVFTGGVPEHRCLIPGNLNLSEAWRNRTIPLQGPEQQRSKCTRYRLDVILNLSQTFPDPDFLNMSEIEQEPCLDGWEYSKEQYISTIVSEWDLVCKDHWKAPFSMSMFFLGVLVGSLVSGQLSDRFGRKLILFGTMAVQCTFSIVQVFAPSWKIFCLLNFLIGLGQISNYVAAFVLGSEILGKSMRLMYSTLGVCISYALGYMLLPFIAYFLRNWRMLLLALSLISLTYIPLWWFIPESPRWLLIKGRVKEAEEILQYIAKKNGVTLPEVLFSEPELEDMRTKYAQSYTIFHLVKTYNIRVITVINVLIWMILTVGYFGLSLSTPNLHGDNYLNCFFSAAIEVPAYTAAWFFLQKFPRRVILSITALFGGAVLILTQFTPSAELYPTAVRNMGVGVCSMASRIGSIVSPYIFYLGVHDEFLPFTLMGISTALSGLLVLLLPETFKAPLPDTFEQMKNVKGFKCGCMSKGHIKFYKKRKPEHNGQNNEGN
ncbi:organic cation/carnitine transporter 2-like isoform X2 [Hypanus sabinus]|uniref:organic cation/carnitine transporter 2-like isoform X2 n=1 Tax=Hypanus sabinus TaxID=79690 RepID=UPI0028C3B8D0|nr:organic cation/carnitine transporter 2-like isoform X2 [Hypanus sabinus]